MKLWNNHYICDCGAEWWDSWDCNCDDRCPDCNKEIEPDDESYEYEDEDDFVEKERENKT